MSPAFQAVQSGVRFPRPAPPINDRGHLRRLANSIGSSSRLPLVPAPIHCPCSPIGRGDGLRSRTVWVRIPPGAPKNQFRETRAWRMGWTVNPWIEGFDPLTRSQIKMGALQIWRVLQGTVNPLPPGKQCRFDSYRTHQLMSKKFTKAVIRIFHAEIQMSVRFRPSHQSRVA